MAKKEYLPAFLQRLLPKSLGGRSSVAVIVLVALLIEATTVIQYWFASRGIREEVHHRAKTELKVKSMEIRNVMSTVQVAIDNMAWAVEARIDQPDSIYTILRKIVKENSTIVGCGVTFIADYYPEKGHWFEPYVAERDNGDIEQAQIGGPTHDYLNTDWHLKGMAAGKGYWSEPYYDNAGARMMLCTYTIPIHDKTGRTVGLLGSDVSLDWLSSMVNARHIYPTSYNVMISREGKLMVCPVESLVTQRTIQEATAGIGDTAMRQVNREMMSGISGQATVRNEKGAKHYIFYTPVEGETGWSMAVVCSDREIYYGLRQVGFYLQLMMLLGMVLLGYIIWRTIRSARRLEAAQTQKAAIENELRIASAIQMALLPKIFPAYPDRTDVDINATLTPAKEVGGDLYDFFIRDEKLFFCIGDVSGKGVPASLVMAVTRTLFRNVTAHEAQPHRILAAINNTLSEENPDNIFVTFFIGVIDLPTGRLRYANAGHESPILLGNGAPEKLPCESNLPLGAMSGWDFPQQEVILHAGTTIFLYTDGLTEAMNHSHALFGKERMMEAFRSSDPHEVIREMSDSIHRFVDGAEQSDDLTMLAIRYCHEHHAAQFVDTLTLPNDVKETPRLADFIEDVCQALKLSNKLEMQMKLAVEEAVVNVMNYAYPEGVAGDVQIKAEANEHRLKFVITDEGIPFDPTAQSDVDTTLSAEERPIGGLGIHLVRHYMDSINYERIKDEHNPEKGKNVLTLRKKIL